MHISNHSVSTKNFNAQPLPVILTSWEQIKAYEPALAELERQALVMQPYGNGWWHGSRLILDRLNRLAGSKADDPLMQSLTVLNIAGSAIRKAFFSEGPSE
ncbi:MAG: hypothetical protein ACKVH8_08415 [Pirellulales bacterium]